MQYRRSKVKGGTYFFTVNLANRQSRLLIDEAKRLGNVMRQVKKQHPFHLDAIIVLPEHLHALWTLPDNDSDYATRWMLIKSGFSRQLATEEKCNSSRRKNGERGIWQRRYWEHMIRDAQDYERHVEYIHYNPVKHGHVEQASDWQYSSIHKYIANGIVEKDWGGRIDSLQESGFGERV